MRDYEKYISRQFKRGASRHELNVSWLKKNELDMKRHVQDLRDNIRSNWTTTGQELSRELRQFWPASRPQSPARLAPPTLPTTPSASNSEFNLREALVNANAAKSPGTERGTNEFISGYTLGLIGGVRSWMTKNRRNVAEESRPVSDDESEESDETKSPRGRVVPSSSTAAA